MSKQQPGRDKLTAAQHRRAMVRADFFRVLMANIAELLDDPGALERVTAAIVAESARVSESLDATDQALLNRVNGMTADPELAVLELHDMYHQLQAQVVELLALLKADDS